MYIFICALLCTYAHTARQVVADVNGWSITEMYCGEITRQNELCFVQELAAVSHFTFWFSPSLRL